jgi:hypothetical protein
LEKMELSIQKQKGFYLKKNSLKKEKYKNEWNKMSLWLCLNSKGQLWDTEVVTGFING